MPLYGAIEAGGTKFVCALGDDMGGHMAVQRRLSIATTTPEETLRKALDFFRPHTAVAAAVMSDQRAQIAAIGIASFGPIDLHRASPTYGHITTTPKAGWPYPDLVSPFGKGFGIP